MPGKPFTGLFTQTGAWEALLRERVEIFRTCRVKEAKRRVKCVLEELEKYYQGSVAGLA